MREKKLERTKREEKKKDKHQIHCVGLHSAKHTHTNRSSSKKKKRKRRQKKNLAVEHRAVRQEESRERERKT
jgi:hypothetical protein